jgi:SAM-dependent methyltransferase
MSEKDYVLGTHDEEIARLGLQHRVWRSIVLDTWRKAGITFGSRVIDVGAGPGFATIDLAEIVGTEGEILAVERSSRFLEVATNACAARGIGNVRFRNVDLMQEPLGVTDYDAAWCRWVACFVPSAATLVNSIAKALRPGGVAIFHEYYNYGTYQFAPRRPALESFVEQVMASWRAAGGEPNIALELPALLPAAGLRLRHVQPHVFTVTPRDYVWRWPASFIEVNLVRLRELGRVSAEWVESVRRAFQEAQADATTLVTTPLLLEIVAERTRP